MVCRYFQVRIVAIKLSPGAPRREYGMQGKMKKLHHVTVRIMGARTGSVNANIGELRLSCYLAPNGL
eukprot:1133623-Pyramimonas_sp.AAC.1